MNCPFCGEFISVTPNQNPQICCKCDKPQINLCPTCDKEISDVEIYCDDCWDKLGKRGRT